MEAVLTYLHKIKYNNIMNKDKETQIRILAENLMRQDNRFEVEGVSDEEYNRYYKLAEQIKEQ
jgi:hypothetical protein